MVRPSKDEKRDRQFNVSLTARELERLRAAAAAARMRPVDFGRLRLFAERRASFARAAAGRCFDPAFMAALSRLGNNLNQIARRLNTFPQPAPPTLEPLLAEIRALIRRGMPDGS